MLEKDNSADIRLDQGCLYVTGSLNFHTVMKIWHKSLPLLEQAKPLNFDFSGVTSAGSAAIALLLEWLNYAKEHNCPISFNQLPEQLHSIAEVSGVRSLLF